MQTEGLVHIRVRNQRSVPAGESTKGAVIMEGAAYNNVTVPEIDEGWDIYIYSVIVPRYRRSWGILEAPLTVCVGKEWYRFPGHLLV